MMGAKLRRTFDGCGRMIFVLAIVLSFTIILFAQEEEAPADSALAVPDSGQVEEESGSKLEREENADESQDGASELDEAAQAANEKSVEERAIEMAKVWLRRLLYRGWVNPTVIGAYTTYQLTEWSEATGSYGGVEGRLTIHYLGPTEWLSKDAESFQAAFQSLDEENNLVEFDLILPAMQRIGEVYRSLMRLNRGELRSTTISMPQGVPDSDVIDRAVEAGSRELKIFAGVFQTELYRGSGLDGTEVVIHRSAKISPLEVLVLGYGEQALTYSSSGSNVVPRFRVPPPPGR